MIRVNHIKCQTRFSFYSIIICLLIKRNNCANFEDNLSFDNYRFFQFTIYNIECIDSGLEPVDDKNDEGYKCPKGFYESLSILYHGNDIINTLYRKNIKSNEPVWYSKIFEFNNEDKIIISLNNNPKIFFKNPKEKSYNDNFWFLSSSFYFRILTRIRIYPINKWANAIMLKLFIDNYWRVSRHDEFFNYHDIFSPSSLNDIKDTVYSPSGNTDAGYHRNPNLVKICDLNECLVKIVSILKLNIKGNGNINEINNTLNKHKYIQTDLKRNNKEHELRITVEKENQYPFKNLEICKNEICLNRGICKSNTDIETKKLKKFFCLCETGFIGDTCEINTKCINCKGKCGSNYTCDICKKGWKGNYCQTPNIEDPDICKNGGILSFDETNNILKCSCKTNYEGNYCEIYIRNTAKIIFVVVVIICLVIITIILIRYYKLNKK